MDALLDRIALQFGTDKFVHGYTPYYERHLGLLRFEPITLLEIGVWDGASLRTWEAWMPEAQIIGVDIALRVDLHTRQITTIQSDIKTYDPPCAFDVVIDDGSHLAFDVVAAWNRLWPYVKPGGWYVFEDLETQFEPGYGGSRAGGSVALDLLKGLAMDSVKEVSTTVSEVHLYRQIAFVRKRL